jgi:hypothetical protein
VLFVTCGLYLPIRTLVVQAMNIPDISTLFVLSLFRGILGLAIGVALGSGLRALIARRLSGLLSLLNAGILFALVLFMYVSISAYAEYEIFYWTVFLIAVAAGSFRPRSIQSAVALGVLAVFSGAFLIFGILMLASGLRLGLNLLQMIAGSVFILIGGTIPALWIIALFKGRSPLDE